jgi:hypothetical protein
MHRERRQRALQLRENDSSQPATMRGMRERLEAS